MTIIVASASEGVMAADTMIVDNAERFVVGYEAKIFRAPDGTLAGASGECDTGNLILNWVKGGRISKPQIKWFKKSSLLLLLPNRTIVMYDESHIPVYPAINYAAIGSGSVPAMAIMSIGGSALDAVRGASNVSCFCGGEPTLLRLET